MKNCEKCGAANEADVRFCVSCGNKLSGSVSANHMNAPYQNHMPVDSEMTDETRAMIEQSPNPLALIWNKLLFPERMIVVGAFMGGVAAIFWGTSIFLLSAFYFVTMFLSLALMYISREASLLKRLELSRWQIVIGTFWLPLGIVAMQIMSSVNSAMGTFGGSLYGTSSSSTSSLYGMMGVSNSIGSITFSLWLSLFSSILILVGAVMLQGMLLNYAFKAKVK